ncbi:MAG TPA: T9SS type A sorting domain-containing protein [Flavipsychrobacter sp.]
MICITYTGFGRSKQAYEKLCEVNKCWTEQTDVQQLAYPVFDNRSEREWIRTHLSLVEQTLRARNTAHLSAQQKANRLNALAHLNQYWREGSFPVNDQYNYRTPIFIDKYDNFCAVGYLVKATGFEQVSRKIAAQTNLAYVREMNYPELFAWATDFGFTVDELAWIQPGYPPETYLQNIGRGTDGNVFELCPDDGNGRLYVGGTFTNVDSTIVANNIAYVTEENGVYTWHTMNNGVNGPVYAILASGKNVYVGGSFTKAGGKDVNNIAYWDGTTWNALGCVDGVVNDMVMFREELYIAGDFNLCDSVSEINFARWRGNKWEDFTSGHAHGTLEGKINTMYTDGAFDIVLGGKFSYNGEQQNIIDYNYYGGFVKYSNKIDNEVNDIGYSQYEGTRYAVTTGDVDSTKLVLKLGSNNYWGAIYQLSFTGLNGPTVKTICARGNEMLVGGDIQFTSSIQPGPKGSNAGRLYQNQLVTYDGIWVDSTINVMTTFKGKLIVGGDFNNGYNGKWSYGNLNSIGHWSGTTDLPVLETAERLLNIFPNPATAGNEVTIRNNIGAKYFRLYDITGRLAADAVIDKNNKVPIPQMPGGLYIVELSNINGEKAVSKLEIE